MSFVCLLSISNSYNKYVYVQATSFDGVFLLVAFHYTALVCNYCLLLWFIKYLYIYLSTSTLYSTKNIAIATQDIDCG